MAQKQVRRGMTDAQINQTVTAQLIDAGYSRQQATQLLTMANTMARGRNVGAPPRWMNGTDLDRVSQAILDARSDRADAARILERTRITGPNMTETQMKDALQSQLVTRGYSEEQARNIVDYAGRMARGEQLTVPPSWGWLQVQDLTTATSLINNGINHPDRARSIIVSENEAQLRRFRGPARSFRMAMVPAPVREYSHEYTVTVDGRSYRLESNRDMRWSGQITGPDQTRGGRLMAVLQTRASLRITELDASGNPRTDSSGNPIVISKQAFIERVRPAYSAIRQEFAAADVERRDRRDSVLGRIDMEYVDASVRRARGGG